MEPLRTPPRLCPPRSVGRASGAGGPRGQRRAQTGGPRSPRPAQPASGGGPGRQASALPRKIQVGPPGRGRCRRHSTRRHRGPAPPGRPLLSHLVTWRREREAGMLKGLTPHKRGPKSKRNPQEEELQKLRRENQHLTEELRKAAIVIDVQKKVGALLGWPLPKVDPEEQP